MAIAPNAAPHAVGAGRGRGGAAAPSASPAGHSANHARRQMSLSRRPPPPAPPRGLWNALTVTMSLRGPTQTPHRRHSRPKSFAIESTTPERPSSASEDERPPTPPPAFDAEVCSSFVIGHLSSGVPTPKIKFT